MSVQLSLAQSSLRLIMYLVNKYKDPCSDKLVKKNQVNENEKAYSLLKEK